jgi:beta-ribofuranosylaminobenzene 5'-phosphate synthase
MSAVRVRAPARLHLGMLDVAGGSTRRFGGLGVAVAHPAVVVEVAAASELSAVGPDADRALVAARRCAAELGIPGARVQVIEAIPRHVGLGSGTKLALAVTHALASLQGRRLTATELARTAGRGARSAVGLWTFVLGGLVLEGGPRWDVNTAAPLLARHPLPPGWRCVLAIPDAQPGLSGEAEEAAFRALRPDREHATAVSHLILTALLPALVEGDLAEFGAALTQMQRLVGETFAPAQGGIYHPQAERLVSALLAHGAAGAGQSSWGPATYGFVGSEEEAAGLVARVRGLLGGRGTVFSVSFDNQGAQLESVGDGP